MTTLLLRLLPMLALALGSTSLAAEHKKVLLVVSGYGQEQGASAPGYEFDEFSKAWLVFKQHAIAVDIASPKGGKVEADKFNANASYNAKVLADSEAMAKLQNTLKTADVNAKDYHGVFVVGGKGAMFDLAQDSALQAVIADIYQQQGTVAAVCHGPAALVDVKLDNGDYLVANKAVNAFTNEEENVFSSKWLGDFPFMLEDKLVERGAEFQASDIMLSHVATDGRLITGQNPTSTVAVATELVRSLGISVVPMPAYKDDKTLALVAQILSGDDTAVAVFKQQQQDFNVPLVGMYGFFYLKVAEDDGDFQKALTLMSLAQEQMNNPKLDMKIAQTQQKLGNTQAALKTLQQVLADKPDFTPAQEMLADLSR